MQYLGLATRSHGDLSVTAIVTAGVTGNAGCAGDPAHYDERNGTWVRLSSEADAKPAGTQGGTINTLLLFSAPLSDSALARAVVTMTEGKSSALTELAVGSKTSHRPATGTGTDQFAIAAPLEGGSPRTWTGKHTKAGELAGLAVREATLEALRWQNGLEPSYTRSILHCLGRFGLSEERLKTSLESLLSPREYQLFKDNWNPVVHEPQLSAACYAFAAVLDRVLAGTFGPSSASECLLNQAALMASGLSARPEAFPAFRSRLVSRFRPETQAPAEQWVAEALKLCLQAIAEGWKAKWTP
jgi:adenosylcobinamide amidohydrolase